MSGWRLFAVVAALCATTALAACGPLPPEPAATPTSATPTAPSSSPGRTSPAPEPTPEPELESRAATEPPAVTIAFLGDVEFPGLPPVPALPSSDAPVGGWIRTEGGWDLRLDAVEHQVECRAWDDTSGSGYQYVAASHPILDGEGEPQLRATLSRTLDGHGEFTHQLELRWQAVDELTAHANASDTVLSLSGDQPTAAVVVSEDRRSVAFSAVTISEPGGYETEGITWMTVTGAMSCPEPLPPVG